MSDGLMAGSVCVTVTLLLCVVGSQALDAGTSGNPQSPPKVDCWCAGYPNKTLCSWPEPSHSPPTHYIATYSERHSPLDIKQGQLFPPNSSSSKLISASSSSEHWHCHLPDLKLLTDYLINITAVYPDGSSSHSNYYMLEDIVKPDPPVNIRVSSYNSTLSMEWSPPHTWSNLEIFPLKYHVEYNMTNRPPRKLSIQTTKVELNVIPGRTYTFKVCAEDLLGLGKHSDWSSPKKIIIPKI